MKLIFIKMKHQPQLLILPIFIIMYAAYFISRLLIYPKYNITVFKTSLVYFNCLSPFLISLIISIQSRFENHRYSFNNVLSLSNRSKWFINFNLFTYLIWLLNIFLYIFIFAIFAHISIIYYLSVFISDVVFIIIWIPLLNFVGIVYGYLYVISLGIITIPFMIYYGTTSMGAKTWTLIPWIYSVRIFTMNIFTLMMYTLVIIFIYIIEQYIMNKLFKSISKIKR